MTATPDHSASLTCATAVAVWANTRWAQGATVAPVSALLDTLGIPRGATVEDLQRRLAIAERALEWYQALSPLDIGHSEIDQIVNGDDQ